jgi:GT2 family glycosyltransferase
MSRAQDWPIAVRLVDVADGFAAITDVCGYPRTRVFVADCGALIGSLDIHNAWRPISADQLRQTIGESLANPLLRRAIVRQLGAAEPPPLDERVAASVVVPSCGRPADLRRCLTSLQEQVTSRRVELIVVDNRPGDRATADLVSEFPHVRLVTEPKPGLSYARNAGFAAATGDILIAIDDDVVAPPGWLERLLASFARPDVMAVTGHVLPLELETRAQCWFEAYGGLGKGFMRREANGDWFRGRRTAAPTWELGATANAAFRASVFRDPRVGMLDEALGAGTPAGCSEDTYLFYRMLKAGHTIVYEPTAWVWHRHRRDDRALRQQIAAYSRGHVAYQLITLLRDGDRRALVRLGWSMPKTYIRRTFERLRGYSAYPIRLILMEIAGNLAGPWAVARSIRRARRLGPGARCASVDVAVRPAPASVEIAPARRTG